MGEGRGTMRENSLGLAGAVASVAIAAGLGFGAIAATPAMAADWKGTQPMHRLYNPNSGEHFYTGSDAERDHLVSLGWRSEGEGWVAPVKSTTPVYRLYNPNAGDHHYTMSKGECDYLVSVGWNYEGIGWYSSDTKAVTLYRQYNPNAKAGAHNYTTSRAESDYLVRVGWNFEGTAWYGTTKGARQDPLANVYEPKPANLSVALRFSVDAKSAIANAAALPDGTTFSWASAPDTSREGTSTGTVRVKYPDGTTDAVRVTVNVARTEAQKKAEEAQKAADAAKADADAKDAATAQAKASLDAAQKAYDTEPAATGVLTMAEFLDSISNGKYSEWAAQTYSSTLNSSVTNKANGSNMTYDNFLAALDYIDKLNQYRTSHGLDAMTVSGYEMAGQMLECDLVDDGTLEYHTSFWGCAGFKDLSWGYHKGSYYGDAVDGWLSERDDFKEDAEAYATNGYKVADGKYTPASDEYRAALAVVDWSNEPSIHAFYNEYVGNINGYVYAAKGGFTVYGHWTSLTSSAKYIGMGHSESVPIYMYADAAGGHSSGVDGDVAGTTNYFRTLAAKAEAGTPSQKKATLKEALDKAQKAYDEAKAASDAADKAAQEAQAKADEAKKAAGGF
jgi:Rib/alpha/Esp surface antigen-like repeat protein